MPTGARRAGPAASGRHRVGTEPAAATRPAAGRHRAGRLRELLVAGLVDSFGLSLGWTMFTLLALMTGGLAEAALYNAAMFGGVVLSAPVTAWLARRWPGRTLIRWTASTEAVLRAGTLVALLAGWAAPVIAAGVLVMYVLAWVGYAGMRAEVAAADRRVRAMTGYALCLAAVEAGGAGVAALLPFGSASTPSTPVLIAVTAVYAASLIPTFVSATRARVPSARAVRAPRARVRIPLDSLAAGGLIMFLGSGPTLLSVALTTELHGRASVAGAALAFSVGALLSPLAVDLIARLRVPSPVAWPLWAAGMIAGWAVAPSHVLGLFLAQLLAGLSLTAFEGVMDARLAATAQPGTVTTVLAWSAATRALGSALAVRTLPVVVAGSTIGAAAGTVTAVLVAAAGGAAVMAVAVRAAPVRPGTHATQTEQPA